MLKWSPFKRCACRLKYIKSQDIHMNLQAYEYVYVYIYLPIVGGGQC